MLVLLLGLCSGILAGMAVGGGTLLVPGLVLLQGTPQHVAQGISLVIFLPTSVLAIITHLKYGRVQWKLALKLALGSGLGAFLGAKLAHTLQPTVLRKIFAFYLLAMGCYQLLVSPKREEQ